MVVVRNTSRRAIKIKEIGKTIPVSDNNYVLPEYIYEKYKNQLTLINMILEATETNKIFNDNKKSDESKPVDIKSQLDDIVNIGGVEYTIAPLAED